MREDYAQVCFKHNVLSEVVITKTCKSTERKYFYDAADDVMKNLPSTLKSGME